MDCKIETPQLNSQQVSSIYDQIKKNSSSKIILDPPYQRDNVWRGKDKCDFIDSLYHGIIPTNIIINENQDDNEKVCIDGKQRMTSIIEFISNKICVTLNNNDGVEEHIYYDRVPDEDEQIEKHNYRIFTNRERSVFNGRQIPVVAYKNLSYEMQVDIFNRIQKGVNLSAGELVSTYFTSDDNNLKNINKLSKNHSNILNKFYDVKRKEDHIMILKYCIFVHDNQVVNLNCTIMKKLNATFFNDKNKFGKALKSVDQNISLIFGDDFLGSTRINKKKFNKHLIQIICFAFHNHAKQIKDMTKYLHNNNKKYINQLKQLSDTVNNNNVKCSTNDGYHHVHELALNLFDEVIKSNNKKINKLDEISNDGSDNSSDDGSDDSSDDSSNDSSDDSSDDSLSDEEIIVSKKNHRLKKLNMKFLNL